MKALLHHLPLILSLLFAAGCATPYEPSGLMGGFSDFQVDADTFAITVDGNGFTDRATLMEHFHRRARDLCVGEYDFQSDIATDTNIIVTKDFAGSYNKHSVTGYVTCKDPIPTSRFPARTARKRPRVEPVEVEHEEESSEAVVK